MQTELLDYDGLSVVILDNNNYGVYDKKKPIIRWAKDGTEESRTYKYAYFSQIILCLKHIAKIVSNERASDLKDWLNHYDETTNKLELLTKE